MKTIQLILISFIVTNCTTKKTDLEENIDTKVKMEEDNTLLKFNNQSVVFYNVENLFDTFDDPNNDGDDEFTPEGEMEWTNERYTKKLSKIVDVASTACSATT